MARYIMFLNVPLSVNKSCIVDALQTYNPHTPRPGTIVCKSYICLRLVAQQPIAQPMCETGRQIILY